MRKAWAVVVGWALVACPDEEQVCTEIGCSDGVNLWFEDASGAAVDGVAGVLSIDGRTLAFDCGDPSGASNDAGVMCVGGGVFVDGAGAESLSYSLDVGGEVIDGEVALEYTKQQPNGPDCPPVCEQASAAVVL